MKPSQSKESLYSHASEAPCDEVFIIGDRIKVKTGGRLGKVAYVGATDFEPGTWVGIVLDKPEGKNNGTVKGREYFKCPDKFGLFCRPNNLIKLRPAPNSPTPSIRSRLGSPTHSVASFAPSIAASQIGGARKTSPFAQDYGYDINTRVITDDGRPGKVKFLDAIDGEVIAGIIFDKPVGDSDGKFKGQRYFQSYPKYATFLPAEQVKRASSTGAALPPRNIPKQTISSKLRMEKQMGVDGGTNVGSSWRGSMESLNSARSPRSPPPKAGIGKQISPIKDKELITSLKKDLQEKEAHLAQLTNELEERRCESERLIQENRSLKLQVGELKNEKEQIEADVNHLLKERDRLEEELNRQQQRYDEMSFVHAEKDIEKDIKIEDLELKLNDIQSKQLQPVIEDMDEDFDKTFAGNSFNDAILQTESTPHNSFFTQTEKPMTHDVETQTDQPKELAKVFESAAIQTDAREISISSVLIQTEKPRTNDTEMQTIPPPSEPVKIFNSTAIQTKITQYANFSAQTFCETVEAAVQSEEEPTRMFNNAAIQTEVKQNRSLYVETEHPKTTEMGAQTDQPVEVVQTPPSSHNGETSPSRNVLELNVTKLPIDAAINTWPSTISQSVSNQSENEKTQQIGFLNSIIAGQQNTIKQLTEDLARAQRNRTPPKVESEKKITAAQSVGNVKKNVQRPYCDHCEMFSHWTYDCPKEEARLAEKLEHIALSPNKREH